MKACGLIVEYNPLHNGHLYHMKDAKETSGADCIIAVMSGSFLQRGEPAIIDKFYRARAALQSGVDIVLELPYPYAVQSSDNFAAGAVHTLHQIGVSSINFGSESGNISHFITSYKTFKEKETIFKQKLKSQLDQGVSFPEASRSAYQQIGLTSGTMDLAKPNNILGFSYVKTILENNLPIQPLTTQRTNSGYHDQTITNSIASATSIRKTLFENGIITSKVAKTIPSVTYRQLEQYKSEATSWHTWEKYFPLIHYRVMTMTPKDLAAISGVDEGLEYRIKKTAKHATSFTTWMEAIKTKRYTWTRLQRMFVHILTNTTKNEMKDMLESPCVPYIRLLGLNQTGRSYINQMRKKVDVPIIDKLSRNTHVMLTNEEKVSDAYYSILPPRQKNQLRKQEIEPPIRI
ncbi:nucleotidyltransferase [Virgibacillus sp. NKC19-3]|uniref:nucleotidyltransferase n=1 Tax=Virgibacillus saliphilus TaxID=2831674 RepID=UPI001C9AC100|nr:nucleotidyltransferase [Virgibacillus sp. NKC19-3]MBY7143739.1 nucleotidyltransferase [Virgibacillus sp. NKC19-3]